MFFLTLEIPRILCDILVACFDIHLCEFKSTYLFEISGYRLGLYTETKITIIDLFLLPITFLKKLCMSKIN